MVGEVAPHQPVSQYRHNVGEDNADAHLKRQIMGREVVVAVTEGKLDFGPWEQIFYGEFDGRRRKRVSGQNHRRMMLYIKYVNKLEVIYTWILWEELKDAKGFKTNSALFMA